MLRLTRVDGLKKGLSLVQKAVERLEKGGLLAIPGEGGYRWVVRGDLESAVMRLKHALTRPESRPLCLLLPDLDAVDGCVAGFDGRARQLAQAFWPGPLVMLMRRGKTLRARDAEPEYSKVAVRIPHHPLATQLLTLCPFPVLSAGAYGPGQFRLVNSQQVVDLFGGRPGFVEAGQAEVLSWKEPGLGLEPTVVDVTQNPPRLLRSGFLSLRDLQRVCPGPWLLSGERGVPAARPRDVGESHIIVVEGDMHRVSRRIKTLLEAYPRSQRVALLVTRETGELAFDPPPRQLVYFATTGSREQPGSVEQSLFEALRHAEQKARASVILVEGIPRQGLGAAVMERLSQVATDLINTEDPGYRGQAGLTSKAASH